MKTLRAELTSVAEQVDRRLPDGQATITVTEEIRLKRTPTQRPSKAIRELDAAVTRKLSPRSVLEILKNAYYYAGWTRHLARSPAREAAGEQDAGRPKGPHPSSLPPPPLRGEPIRTRRTRPYEANPSVRGEPAFLLVS